MSIAVALENLPAEIDRRGAGYLLTTVADGRPHVMRLRFEVDQGPGGVELRAPVGRSAAANIGAQAAVTLLWSPLDDGSEHAGYSLIVDAVGRIDGGDTGGGGGGPMAVLRAVGAVLHRPA